MDEEGIDVAVIYPSRGLFALTIPDMDPRLAAAVARGYNNWLYDFCQADHTRLIGAGMISPFAIEDAVSETRRCVQELGVPVGFHEGAGAQLRQVGEQFGSNGMLRHVFCHPVEQMMAAASFCGGGILERHPNLRAAFLGGNCSWLPFLMWRMDEHWERTGDVHAPELKMAPSAYWKRQCFASAEADEEPVKYVIAYMGNGGLVFSTDFPHGDSKFPTAVERFLQIDLPDEDKRKILWDNCASYYGMK